MKFSGFHWTVRQCSWEREPVPFMYYQRWLTKMKWRTASAHQSISTAQNRYPPGTAITEQRLHSLCPRRQQRLINKSLLDCKPFHPEEESKQFQNIRIKTWQRSLPSCPENMSHSGTSCLFKQWPNHPSSISHQDQNKPDYLKGNYQVRDKHSYRRAKQSGTEEEDTTSSLILLWGEMRLKNWLFCKTFLRH